MQVELDAFSGRPNPCWTLTEAQEKELLARFGQLQPAQGGSSRNEGLGYRGFIVRGQGTTIHGYDEVKLDRGIVFARQGDRETRLIDPGRYLERLLLESAQGQVPEAVLQYVQSEIAH